MTDIADFVTAGRCGCCGQKPEHWTPQRMVDALNAWVREHGFVPRMLDWGRSAPDHPHYGTPCHVFGSWNGFIRASGLRPVRAGTRPWTRDQIADAMLGHLLRVGRWPTKNEWSRGLDRGEQARPSASSVVREFGSWNDAKRYAGWDGLNPNANREPYIEPRCSECGTELENTVIGCLACHDRHRARANRQAETAAVSTTSPAAASDRKKVPA